MAPPATARRGAGTIDLARLAALASDRHLDAFPDERERYGADVAEAWCRHDLQHVLNWAVADVDRGDEDLLEQVRWLVGVLDARDYDTRRLDPAFRTLAAVVDETGDTALADRLREAAAEALRASRRA